MWSAAAQVAERGIVGPASRLRSEAVPDLVKYKANQGQICVAYHTRLLFVEAEGDELVGAVVRQPVGNL